MSSDEDLIRSLGEDTFLWSPLLHSRVKSSDLLENKVVLLYFSSHWCGPCKTFTPLLCDLYKSLKSQNTEDFEIVFCSMDAFECEYNHYCNSMPWWCLPFQSPVASRLATMYKAEGIPSLVVIDRDGRLITRDAVSQVACDPAGLNFPWRPRSLVELLPEHYLHADSGSERLPMRGLDEKYLLLFAAGQWCRPCRHFTKTLAKAYHNLIRHRQDFEILFLSSDADQESFDSFFGQMPFGAIPFGERAAKAAIANKFSIRRVPVLLVFGPKPACGADRPLINADARGIIEGDDYITEFPYRPKKYGDLNVTTHDINTSKSIIVFSEHCDNCEQDDIQEVLRCASDAYVGSEDVMFFWVTYPTPFTQTLRDALRLPARQQNPIMILLDIPDSGGFYVSTCEDVSIESVLSFLNQPGTRLQI
ncbi:hypothetical protein ACA910_003789 [Epithemia clementina (nom. ined.)]